MSSAYQQAKQPGNVLTRPAPQQTVARSPAAPKLQNEQRTYGNHAVNRLLETQAVQAKMEVTPPSDSYEQEAEQIADQVTRMSEPSPLAAGTSQISRLPESISRAAKADSKDDQKKPAGGGKKKEDDKVKRAADKDDSKDKDRKKPEDELVKRAAAKDDKKEDKKKDEGKKKEDEKVKRAADGDMKDDEDKVQRAADTESVPDVTPEIERSIHDQRNSGQPIPDSMRSYFEPRFGKDLSNVRLHTDSRAADTASKLKARAFTHGQDIYFANGKYQPQADSGKRLLAHEITHTLQQSGGPPTPAPQAQIPAGGPLVSRAQANLVQRNGADDPPVGGDPKTGILAGDTITFDTIGIPGFKLMAHRGPLYAAQNPLKRTAGNPFKRGDTKQRAVWQKKLGAETDEIQAKLKTKADKATAAKKNKSGSSSGGSDWYAFTTPLKMPLAGTLESIAKKMVLPKWDREGTKHDYDVDHILELQLADWNGSSGPANDTPNMELLDSSINSSSGSQIKDHINKKVKEFVIASKTSKSEDDIKNKYNLVFLTATAEGSPSAVDKNKYWTPEEIKQGLQLDNEKISLDPQTLGGNGQVFVFPKGEGGYPEKFPVDGKVSGGSAEFLKPFTVRAATFLTDVESVNSPNFGSLTIEIPAGHPHFKPVPAIVIQLTRIPGAQFAASLDFSAIVGALQTLEHVKASPVEVGEPEVEPGKGITVSGAIKPDIPLFEGQKIGFEMSGNDLEVDVEFGLGALKVPKPFLVKGSTIRIFASTGKGLGASGQVDFVIERVGDGYLKVEDSTSGPFSVEGSFNFDNKLFDPAKITLGYENKQFKAGGQLGIPENKVKGIKTASVTANYEAGTFKASGTAELTVPGVKKGDLTVEYSEAAGFKIGGLFTLEDTIPGLKGGNAKVSVEQADDSYKVKADITAQPAIPGFSAEVKGTYDDGSVDLSAKAGYQRGIASGNLTLGATNRPVDEDGNPTGAGKGDRFSAYGGGEVTLRLTEWLQGTVGVKIKTDGQVVVKGKLGLPSSVNLFPKKEVKQTLFAIGTTIPILPPLIAEIGGNMDASASFGPGQLRDLSLEVTYNPDHEEETVAEGHGEFFVPAEAGLALSVHAGIGASVAVASLTGGVDVGGQLGIQGKAAVGVDIKWNPQAGLDVKGDATASAEPNFVFKVNGYVKADLGTPPFSINLYERKWNLASFEYGSGLTFGVTLPVHYNSKQPFDIKFDDIQIQRPQISTDKILSDVLARLN
jgi:hypothetical protein